MLWWYTECKKKKKEFEGDWAELRQNFVCLDNPGPDIWNRLEKSNKTGQEKKSLISTFACFLTVIVKV